MYRERLQITNVKLLPQECLIGSCLGDPGEKMNAVSDSLDTPNDKARNGLLEINPRSRGNKNIFVVSLKKMFVNIS